MIVKNFEEIKNNFYPVVIIGSGPAGISLALTLEKKKVKCLVIEAGKEKYDNDSQQFYKSIIVGDSITDLKHSRLRQFGGTSGHWGGWSKPMDKFNIESWGLNFNEFSEYRDETCNILNIKNNFEKSKLNNYFNQIQFQYSKVRFAKKFRNKIENSEYIDLLINAQATHFNGNNEVINSVSINNNEKKYLIKSKIFILSCGAVENSRILLWTRE
ncbi:FAD-binding protein, partial [Candidatus Pelagibacter sp.]|nr:FAD-binding protein [Candidatus Pelagibacter sp.]